MKLWLLKPQSVISRNDGDRHYVNGAELCRLYGVTRDECYIPNDAGQVPGIPKIVFDNLVPLAPRYDGDYVRVTDEFRLNQTDRMQRILDALERERQEARWKGVPVKNQRGDIIGRVVEAKICYNPDRAEVTLEVEPSFARYLIANEPKGGFSVGQ